MSSLAASPVRRRASSPRPLAGVLAATAATAAMGLSLLTGGCAEGDGGTIVVAGVPVREDDCTVQGMQMTRRSRGALNLGLRSGYILTPAIANQMDPDIDESRLLTANTFDVSIRGAEVEIQNSAGAPLGFEEQPNPFTIPASGFVPLASVTPISIPVIPEVYGEQLPLFLDTQGSTYVVRLSIFGRTSGGREVETPPFTFVIEVSDTPDPCVAYCAGLGFTPNAFVQCGSGDAETELACIVGQDDTTILSQDAAECGGDDGDQFCSCF